MAVLQHVPFEGPGLAGDWLREQGIEVSIVRLYAGDPLPAPSATDGVLAMGGPMSALDEALFPWLRGEMDWLRSMVERGTPTMGICLGAQLMARAFGAPVHLMEAREIGWHDVEGAHETREGVFRLPKRFQAFHWHGERVDPPSGATLLAFNDRCPNQAYQLGPRAIGFQFHLETDGDSLEALVDHCPNDLEPGPWTQTADEMRSGLAAHGDAARGLMVAALEFVFLGGRSTSK